jgi:hypothetical protein
MVITSASKHDSDVWFSGRMKRFPGSSDYELLVCSRPLFRRPGWERVKGKYELREDEIDRQLDLLGWTDGEKSPERPAEADPERARDNLLRAARRAAAAVRDYAMSNDFKWFVTLTLDADKVDRYDPVEVTRRLNRWLSNLVQRQGLKYVLVAERHKDGAIHFHGLVNDVPGFISSGTWIVPGHKKPIKARSAKQAREWAEKGDEAGYHEVFNWERWPLGFSTGIRLYGDYHAAVGYVCKYIKKQTSGSAPKVGGRWYYSGGGLRKPSIEYIQLDVEWMRENCPGAFFFPVESVRAEFGVYYGNTGPGAENLGVEKLSLQKPDCEITAKT